MRFCWTRCGTEAGEEIDDILVRKERERQQNGGVFLWGIGNALGPSIRGLLRQEPAPEVIFSPMVSLPKPLDVSPPGIFEWKSARDLEGRAVSIPMGSKVTSRASAGPRPARHYALVCLSETALELSPDPPTFLMSDLVNLLTNKQVGASQVTAVVRRIGAREARFASVRASVYRAALRARLVAPFFLELAEPALSKAREAFDSPQLPA